MFYVFFLYFLIDVVHIPASTAGLIMLIATIWDAVTDPAVGIISDRTKSRFGRRRPFMLFTALPFAIATWLLFTDFHMGRKTTIAYFIFAVIFFFTAYTLIGVPYTALAAEMTRDYDERSSLALFRVGWSQAFTIIGASCTLVLSKFFKNIVGSERAGWSITAAMYGLFGIFPILLAWKVTKGYELFPEKVSISLKDVYTAALRNRPFLFTIGIYTFGAAALNVAAAILVYFTKYNMRMSEEKSSFVFLLLFMATLLWVPVIAIVTSKLGKRFSYIIFTCVWALSQAVAVLFLNSQREALLYAIIALAASGVAVIPLVVWSMVPDVVEVDEFKTGERREGLYFGITAFIQKAAVAVVVWLVGVILLLVGYRPDVEQTVRSLTGIRLLFAWGPALFLGLSIALTFLLPMTRERHNALKEAIR